LPPELAPATGAQAPTYQGGLPPGLFLLIPSEDEYSSVPGEESPCCSRSRCSSLRRSWRSRCRLARSFLRTARSRSHCCDAQPTARESGVGGTDFAALSLTICKQNTKVRQQHEYK
jgi:hypothetical protein